MTGIMRPSLVFLTCAILLTMLQAPASGTESLRSPADHPRVERCRDERNVALTVRCVFREFDPPGSPRFAVRVAACESGLRPRVHNPPYVGLYQHRIDLWPERWRHWGRPVGVRQSPRNPLSASVVTARMARVAGWSSWSCAA